MIRQPRKLPCHFKTILKTKIIPATIITTKAMTICIKAPIKPKALFAEVVVRF